VDKAGRTVDLYLSGNREVNAAKDFLRSAMKKARKPTKITLDAYAASHRAVREMKEAGELSKRVRVRSSQYLNNLIEQDHRRVKQRIRPMLGFKRFDNAAVSISGIELAEKIKKGQFKTGKLRIRQRLCRNCGARRSPLDPIAGAQRGRAKLLALDPSLHRSHINARGRPAFTCN
jgi:transposase-like protein